MMLVPLSSACEIIMGQAPPGDTYNDKENGLPLIAGASDFGEISPRPSRFTSRPSKSSEVGDIILCIRATIGDLNWSDRQ
jgi:type I restriction enzyme S subunit